jgi:hypothetical protein
MYIQTVLYVHGDHVPFYGINFTFADTNLQENSSASDAGTELQREDSSEMGYHEVVHTIKIY